MRRTILLVLVASIGFSGISQLCIVSAYPQGQVGVKSGDWMQYDVVTEELNWTGWQRFDLYEVDGTLIKFNATTYSESGGYTRTTGQFNMSEMNAYTTYPNDVIVTFVIPANLEAGDTLLFYGMGPITIAGETEETYLGATRKAIYATYTPPSGVSSEASRVDYKWDKTTGIVLEYLAFYPDGKTTAGKIAHTDLWQPQQTIDPYLLYTVVAMVVAIVVIVILLLVRRKRKPAETTLCPVLS